MAAAIILLLTVQTFRAVLHKSLHPLVDMATAHADRRGNVGDRHPVSQE